MASILPERMDFAPKPLRSASSSKEHGCTQADDTPNCEDCEEYAVACSAGIGIQQPAEQGRDEDVRQISDDRHDTHRGARQMQRYAALFQEGVVDATERECSCTDRRCVEP